MRRHIYFRQQVFINENVTFNVIKDVFIVHRGER